MFFRQFKCNSKQAFGSHRCVLYQTAFVLDAYIQFLSEDDCKNYLCYHGRKYAQIQL